MLNSQGLINLLTSHAQNLGIFDSVNNHEPAHPPQTGLHYSLWCDTIRPIARVSGLDATSARIAFMGRVWSNLSQQPGDAIEPGIMNATDMLMSAYSADFSLGGLALCIDLLAAYYGEGLFASSGYVDVDGAKFRVMTITIPVIVDNAWGQSP